MSFWTSTKRGFFYGLGGRIGWELGGLVWRWVSRLVLVLSLGLTAQCTALNMAHKAQQPGVEKRHQAKKFDSAPKRQVKVVPLTSGRQMVEY